MQLQPRPLQGSGAATSTSRAVQHAASESDVDWMLVLADDLLLQDLLPQLSPVAGGELDRFAATGWRGRLLSLQVTETVLRGPASTALAAPPTTRPPRSTDVVLRAQQEAYWAFYLRTAPTMFADTAGRALACGHLDNAALWAHRALALDAHVADAEGILGRVYFARGAWQQAEASLQRAVLQNRHNAALWTKLGAARLYQRDATGAALALEIATELATGVAEGHDLFGKALFLLGQYARAEAQFAQVWQRQPSSFEAYRNMRRARELAEASGALLARN